VLGEFLYTMGDTCHGKCALVRLAEVMDEVRNFLKEGVADPEGI
jgi:hypothetical protein